MYHVLCDVSRLYRSTFSGPIWQTSQSVCFLVYLCTAIPFAWLTNHLDREQKNGFSSRASKYYHCSRARKSLILWMRRAIVFLRPKNMVLGIVNACIIGCIIDFPRIIWGVLCVWFCWYCCTLYTLNWVNILRVLTALHSSLRPIYLYIYIFDQTHESLNPTSRAQRYRLFMHIPEFMTHDALLRCLKYMCPDRIHMFN